MGEWVLRTACRQNRLWQTMGLPATRVAVNVAGRQFADRGFFHKVVRILKETGLNPRYLELELTENVAMKDTHATVDALRKLHEIGVSICIDDFGTGYSSLNYLRLFPIDRLKIDHAFVGDLATCRDNLPILEAIVGVAHALGLKVVAEGIENKTQLGLLWSLDCDEWQGFYFQQPLLPEGFAALQSQGIRGSSFSFQWTPDLSVHVETLDHQHKEWFRRAGELVRAVMKNRTEKDLTSFITFLEDYARLHFFDEERLMERHQFPGYEAQKHAHRELTARVESMRALASSSQLTQDAVVEIVADLADWFVNHIVKMDKPLGNFLRGKVPSGKT
jgi:hemerythrin-like metal-binding protein